jgi:bifunctional non-homologous end joining protein LigD
MAAKRGTSGRAGAKQATAKKTPAKRVSAKKAPAKKAPTKKTPAKKAGATSSAKAARAKRAPATKRTGTRVTTKPAAKKTAAKTAAVPEVREKLTAYRRKRDFARTREPSGDAAAPARRTLRFVVQKHAASHLHFDFRLELGGVMKSWAVPKGPSVVPGVRRLAMEVEDHPISYNTFEGTIPAGEYGGGTVMLWDRGSYGHTDGGGEAALREGYEAGKLDITLHGERLEGAFTLVRTRGSGERAQWLLMKRTDEHADRARDIVAEVVTSVASGRTMEEIEAGRRR